MHEDVFEVQSCCFLSCNFLVAGDKDGGFSTIVVNYCQDRITPLRLWELRYEIESNCFEWKCFWFGVDRLQRHTNGVCIDFVSLAFCTALDIFRNVLGHFWPPVLPCC